MTTEDDLKLIEKLNSNPSLKKRVEEILNITHNHNHAEGRRGHLSQQW